jgi:hypothetical protein
MADPPIHACAEVSGFVVSHQRSRYSNAGNSTGLGDGRVRPPKHVALANATEDNRQLLDHSHSLILGMTTIDSAATS